MKNIDVKRFTNLLNWDLRTYKKEYTTMLMAAFGYTLLIALTMSNYITVFTGDYHVSNFLSTQVTPFAVLFVMCAMLGVAGRAFQHIQTNQERIAYIMLPASNIEKYIVRVVCRTIIMFVLIIAAVIAADLIFGVLVWIRTGEFYNVISMSKFFNNVLGTGSLSIGQWCAQVLAVLLTWSFFVLGSAFFRRRATLMTFLCLFAAALVISALIAMGAGFMVEWLIDHDMNVEFPFDRIWFDVIGNLIVLLWLSFNIWYSYRLFSRMQVINNRWNNK